VVRESRTSESRPAHWTPRPRAVANAVHRPPRGNRRTPDATDRDRAGAFRVISDGRYTVRQGEKEVATGTFTVDPGKTPMAIDKKITNGDAKGKTAVGIYEVKGDDAKMAWARPGETDRPTEFSGKSHRMTTLKRIKS